LPYFDASLLEQLTAAVDEQHAREIIDSNYFWTSCEQIEQNSRLPLIVYDTEWVDEQVESLSAPMALMMERKCSEQHATQAVRIEQTESMVNHSIMDDERACQYFEILSGEQSPMNIDHRVHLENALQYSSIIALDRQRSFSDQSYIADALSNSNAIRPIYQVHPQVILRHDLNPSIECSPYAETSSSLLEMELFLNQFEESLDHEQHLPLIDQISLSYATSMHERRNLSKSRTLPFEWFQPSIVSADEQLVEQWTVETDIETIPHYGTLPRHEKFDEPTTTSLPSPHAQYVTHAIVSHCSPTSDYETDSLDKDNETTSTTSDLIVTVSSTAQIHGLSSTPNTTYHSQSSPLLTSFTAPLVPIVYFLDALAVQQPTYNPIARQFLMTIGFGRANLSETTMNEPTSTLPSAIQPMRATWISRPFLEPERLPTIIHQGNDTAMASTAQQVNYAVEINVDEDEAALLIYPHRLQYGYDLGENAEGPLAAFYEPGYLHLAVVNEIMTYQASIPDDFSSLAFSESSMYRLVAREHKSDIRLPGDYQIDKKQIFSFARALPHPIQQEHIQAMPLQLDQPIYIDHYHVQSLHPFSKTCYAEMTLPPIIHEHLTIDKTLLPDIIPITIIQGKVIHRRRKRERGSFAHALTVN
jgi:hypothetical protein